LGILGRRLRGSTLPPKERILGVRCNDASTAFVLKDVKQAGVVQTEVGGMPILIASLGWNLPVVAFERRVAQRVFTFDLTGSSGAELEDSETHSRWRASDGIAVDGPLKGERLVRATVYPAYWFGWRGFFPRSAVWKQAP
jgi:hypothetical protein